MSYVLRLATKHCILFGGYSDVGCSHWGDPSSSMMPLHIVLNIAREEV